LPTLAPAFAHAHTHALSRYSTAHMMVVLHRMLDYEKLTVYQAILELIRE
jgi:hypothetical protein